MLAQARQEQIIKLLKERGSIVKMTELAALFDVSGETIRRDLENLQDMHLIQRVYGGAMLADQISVSHPKTLGHAQRAAIGRATAALIRDGETLLLSSGTTVLEVARNLKNHHNLTIITNSLSVANELLDTDFEIDILGGRLDHDELDTIGDLGYRAMQGIFVDKTIIGAGGVTFEYGISDYNSGDAAVRAEMMRRTSKIIMVAQGDKFGHNALRIRHPLDKVHTIVSDTSMPEEYVTGIRKMGLELILADANGSAD